ncbi:hypothetical protein P7K49_018308 [Saguinus oedipus]|uniref:Uncharacterized protein n=1 Tax=Saguinus oedipus TaxID=9490 RepID=A0ABQ9V7S1_SAGOE|nr:hypothetical protein P7K49_018308 [Saguinus oedipus]
MRQPLKVRALWFAANQPCRRCHSEFQGDSGEHDGSSTSAGAHVFQMRYVVGLKTESWKTLWAQPQVEDIYKIRRLYGGTCNCWDILPLKNESAERGPGTLVGGCSNALLVGGVNLS